MEIEFRAIIHFFFLRNESNTNIHRFINETYGENSIGLSTVKRWTKFFKEGKMDLEDRIRSGRPRNKELIKKVAALVEKNSSLSFKKIAVRLGCSQTTVKKILTMDLGLNKVSFKWIPFKLNPNQKNRRVQISKELITILENSKRKCNILTGDETWLYYENSMPSVWQRSEVKRPSQPKKTIASKKVMACVIWSISGIHCFKDLPNDKKFNSSFFSGFFFFFVNFPEVLDELDEDLAKRRPKLRSKGIKLHIDNARPHSVQDKLDKLGISRLPHPPYSPDLAPSDFFLFGYLKNKLIGCNFDTREDLLFKSEKILKKITRDTLEKVFEEWIKRLKLCIELEGDYLPK